MPHLLDIDGDICHHAHNTVKKFLSPFNKYIEHLTDDIHTDMKYSPDLRDYEICAYIDVHYRMPVDRVDHHWLSLFDAAHTTLFLYKALVLFYFAWVPEDMKSVYQQDIDELLSQCSTAVKKRVKTIQKVCHQKSLTKAGKSMSPRLVWLALSFVCICLNYPIVHPSR